MDKTIIGLVSALSTKKTKIQDQDFFEYDGKFYHTSTPEEWDAFSIEEKKAIGKHAKDLFMHSYQNGEAQLFTISTLVDDSMDLNTAIFIGREEGVDFIQWKGDLYPTYPRGEFFYDAPIVTEVKYVEPIQGCNTFVDHTQNDDSNLILTEDAENEILGASNFHDSENEWITDATDVSDNETIPDFDPHSLDNDNLLL
ncbi:MAG: hypothetical protein LBC84_07180 [Prevotellaceae bacterium]|jgi:hypothetical protein|nr:hypothetical protein [Prevotellaceae bacterium]